MYVIKFYSCLFYLKYLQVITINIGIHYVEYTFSMKEKSKNIVYINMK